MKRAWLLPAVLGIACCSSTAQAEVGLPASAAPDAESQPEAVAAGLPPSGEVLDRQWLIAAVLDANPSLRAAREARAAASARIDQTESLTDPTASYSLAPLSLGSDDARFGEVLRIAQRFPFPGTLGVRGEVAAAEAETAGLRVEEARLDLGTMASLLFDRHYLVARSLEANAEHLRLLESFQRVATDRYAAGLAPQQAPIQAEVEAAHVLHRQVVLEIEQRQVGVRINALLHREPRAPLPPAPRDLGLPAPPETPMDRVSAALAARPEVEAQRTVVQARRAAISLARLDAYPDFEVAASYNSMWGTPEHRWAVGAALNLPLYRRRVRAGIAEAEARLAAEQSLLASLEDEVGEATEIAALALEEALHVARLYESKVLPATRDQLAAARSGFETGANTMLALIDAERSLRTAELSYFQAVAAASSRRAELDRALGRLPFAPDAAGERSHPAPEPGTEMQR